MFPICQFKCVIISKLFLFQRALSTFIHHNFKNQAYDILGYDDFT